MTKELDMELKCFLAQQQERKNELLSLVLKAFETHTENTLKDIEVFLGNLKKQKRRKK